MKRRQTGLELGEGMRHVWGEEKDKKETKKQLKEKKKKKKRGSGAQQKDKIEKREKE